MENNRADNWLVEVEEIEATAENFRLGLRGFGHEVDYAALPDRIERALSFRVGIDPHCIRAKASLRSIATAFGFDLATEEPYFGAPIPREVLADDTVRERLTPLPPYPVVFATARDHPVQAKESQHGA